MASAAALRVSPREFGSLWEDEAPDLVLDPDEGAIHPLRPETGEISRGQSVVEGIGKAVASAAPVAGSVLLSSIPRWD